MKKLCRNCKYVDVNAEGISVCRFYPPKAVIANEGSKLQLVEPAIDPGQVACHKYEDVNEVVNEG